MKNLIFLLSTFLFALTLTAQNSITISAGESIELDYPEYEACQASIKNKSMQTINVAVLAKEDKKQLRGFGLGKKGKEEIMVENTSLLVISNNSKKEVTVNVEVKPVSMKVIERPAKAISFTLQNTSAETIPLLIPTVMNPNLSPNSMSGVDLKVGQEIFFRAKGKKQLLLTVDSSIKDGDVLDVATLLVERKQALGLMK